MSNHSFDAKSLLYTMIDMQTIQLVSILGVGAYGVVYLGRHVYSRKHYAVKLLTHLHISYKEVDVHAYLSGHPNILKFEKVVFEAEKTFMVIEYTPEGDLFSAITRPHNNIVGNNQAIRHIFLQILDAVHYCHEHHISHRDLKPENIMLGSKLQVKLADFGLATLDHVSNEFGCGSTFYFSPECQGGSTRIKGYNTQKNDIWSLGIILINLTAGRNPWKQAHTRNAAFANYVRNPRHFFRTILPCISDELERILLRIFCLNPVKRISLRELRHRILKCQSFVVPQQQQHYHAPPPTLQEEDFKNSHCNMAHTDSVAQTMLQYVGGFIDN
ncbi:kinase-like domain-containing protein [Mucor mucedo]|uniref:kinase-like domain-containing protein n=1 Tax=Mucor mucedo TaxID=29922 RepID=UPI00221F1716|nr:kinase-like domain-containing protein [Mucor mucedo]KAI7895418.1 kinase-like domain-containing protein [Mucor mucedo]